MNLSRLSRPSEQMIWPASTKKCYREFTPNYQVISQMTCIRQSLNWWKLTRQIDLTVNRFWSWRKLDACPWNSLAQRVSMIHIKQGACHSSTQSKFPRICCTWLTDCPNPCMKFSKSRKRLKIVPDTSDRSQQKTYHLYPRNVIFHLSSLMILAQHSLRVVGQQVK
jgi:hypothetical protein